MTLDSFLSLLGEEVEDVYEGCPNTYLAPEAPVLTLQVYQNPSTSSRLSPCPEISASLIAVFSPSH